MKAMWHAATVPDEKSLQRELEAQGHAKRSAPTQLTPQGDGESVRVRAAPRTDRHPV